MRSARVCRRAESGIRSVICWRTAAVSAPSARVISIWETFPSGAAIPITQEGSPPTSVAPAKEVSKVNSPTTVTSEGVPLMTRCVRSPMARPERFKASDSKLISSAPEGSRPATMRCPGSSGKMGAMTVGAPIEVTGAPSAPTSVPGSEESA